jgi:hypothetical protein
LAAIDSGVLRRRYRFRGTRKDIFIYEKSVCRREFKYPIDRTTREEGARRQKDEAVAGLYLQQE